MEKSMNFGPSGRRLLSQLRPERAIIALALILGISSVALMSVGPKILGHATDLIFNGFIG
ncbi:hypothetical protein GCM10020000_35070 [Streptomyces olivoverticillatus]